MVVRRELAWDLVAFGSYRDVHGAMLGFLLEEDVSSAAPGTALAPGSFRSVRATPPTPRSGRLPGTSAALRNSTGLRLLCPLA